MTQDIYSSRHYAMSIDARYRREREYEGVNIENMTNTQFKKGYIVFKARPYSSVQYCHYGGEESQIPIGTKGIVIDIESDNSIRIKFDNCLVWSVDPKEIELVESSITPITSTIAIDINENRLIELREAQESGLISPTIKHKILDKEREKIYLKYFRSIKDKVLSRKKFKLPPSFEIGDCVKGGTSDGTFFDEGIIIKKIDRNYMDVLIYKRNKTGLERTYVDRCYISKLIKINKRKRFSLKKTKRLFEPKRIMTIKTNIKDLVKTIKKLDSVKECKLVKGKDLNGKSVYFLYVITKDLTFVDNRECPYNKKGQKYNFGEYEIKMLIPPKKYDMDRIKFEYCIYARRIKGAVEIGEESEEAGCLSYNPYISCASESHPKIFRAICFGNGLSYIKKTYYSKDYFALIELIISNFVSISDEGFVKINDFLKALGYKRK